MSRRRCVALLATPSPALPVRSRRATLPVRSRRATLPVRSRRATLADLHDEWQATDRRYLSEDSMSLLYPQRDSLATAELTAGHHHRGSTPKPTT